MRNSTVITDTKTARGVSHDTKRKQQHLYPLTMISREELSRASSVDKLADCPNEEEKDVKVHDDGEESVDESVVEVEGEEL